MFSAPRLSRALGVVVIGTALAIVVPTPSWAVTSRVQSAALAPTVTATCRPLAAPPAATPYPAYYRPTAVPGMRDAGPKKIKHVREIQYRLRWLGFYKGQITGRYTVSVTTAVKKMQKAACLPQTGVMYRSAWYYLILKTTKRLSAMPAVCKASGWHSCYDRWSHQDFLLHNGKIINVWLVRGGMKSTKTRTGTYKVFARYKYKVSTEFHVGMYYFQKHSGGQGQHGSIYMYDPFVGHSHGCVNMYITDSKVLWALTKNKTLKVTVYGSWK